MGDIIDLDTMADMASLIKAARRQQKLTQAEAAARAGISRQHFSDIETGKATRLELPTLLRVLTALHLRLRVEPGNPEVNSRHYPQLQSLCWNMAPDATLTEAEALALYERNWRFVEKEKISEEEQHFLEHLMRVHGKGVLLV